MGRCSIARLLLARRSILPALRREASSPPLERRGRQHLVSIRADDQVLLDPGAPDLRIAEEGLDSEHLAGEEGLGTRGLLGVEPDRGALPEEDVAVPEE